MGLPMLNPPSTTKAWPVINDASSEAKNRAACAMSSGSPKRRAGAMPEVGDDFILSLVAPCAAQHGGSDRSWANGIGVDVVWAVLQSHLSGQVNDPGFGRIVGWPEIHGQNSGDGSRIDNNPAPGFPHLTNPILRAKKDTFKVDIDDSVPFVLSHQGKRSKS